MVKSLLIPALLLLTLSTAFSQNASPSAPPSGDRIAPDPKAGFIYPYYIYVPQQILDAPKDRVNTFLVLPNNTGKIDDDLSFHENDVKRRMTSAAAIASMLDVAVIMPVFPRPKSDWRIYVHALDRDSMVTDKKDLRRPDLQLIAMIDHARSEMRSRGINFDHRVLINGFSAQGMFANRFTFLHPDRVKAAVVGSPGGWPIAPVAEYKGQKLRYPIGVADVNKVAGKKIDLKQLQKVPFFIYLGDQDENDSVPYDDSYDAIDRELINPLFGRKPVERWEISKELYKSSGLNAEFRLYSGVAHTITPAMREDIRLFLMKHK